MTFYLVNNTDWQISDSFLSWLMAATEGAFPRELQKKLADKEVGIVLVDEVEMSQLNQKYRGKTGPTDILSFEGDENQLGELILCESLIKTQAQEHQLHELEEFTYLVVHGLLHLLGYDHEVPADEIKMFDIQDKTFDVLMDQGIVDHSHG